MKKIVKFACSYNTKRVDFQSCYRMLTKKYIPWISLVLMEQRHGEGSKNQAHEYFRKISSETHHYGTLERKRLLLYTLESWTQNTWNTTHVNWELKIPTLSLMFISRLLKYSSVSWIFLVTGVCVSFRFFSCSLAWSRLCFTSSCCWRTFSYSLEVLKVK